MCTKLDIRVPRSSNVAQLSKEKLLFVIMCPFTIFQKFFTKTNEGTDEWELLRNERLRTKRGGRIEREETRDARRGSRRSVDTFIFAVAKYREGSSSAGVNSVYMYTRRRQTPPEDGFPLSLSAPRTRKRVER